MHVESGRDPSFPKRCEDAPHSKASRNEEKGVQGNNEAPHKEQDGREGKVNVAGFKGKTVINRKDFGIGTTLGIGENVTITISLEADQSVK